MNLAELLERYDGISKQAFYSRCRALGMVLDKDLDGKIDANPQQIKLLDELQEHISKGGSLKSFNPPPKPEQAFVVETEVMPEPEPEEGKLKKIDSVYDRLLRIVEEQQQVIVIQPERSPIQHHRELSEAAREGWLLTTKEVKEIVGVKPVCQKGGDIFTRGCWQFTKAGKIGGAIAWRVEKIC